MKFTIKPTILFTKLILLALIPMASCSHYSTLTSPRKIQHLPFNFKTTDLRYKKIDRKSGIWTGKLIGDGTYSLRLKIFNRDRQIANKFMGKVQLNYSDKPKSFQFKSDLPKKKFNRWLITARRIR